MYSVFPIASCCVMALIAMAFFTLLERKLLGYIQLRKGPNKVSAIGLPQPLADAMKLLLKEQSKPTTSNFFLFILAPATSLMLALLMWILYPLTPAPYSIMYGCVIFLCISSFSVYTIIGAGWASNSNYAMLGAMRNLAQTISYEISLALFLLYPLTILKTFNLTKMTYLTANPLLFISLPIFLCWVVSAMAELNRTPFDLAEGESELVSGFNIEYSSGAFAMIFMAEYTNILVMSFFTSSLFLSSAFSNPLSFAMITFFMAFIIVWARGTLPRMRYDNLMYLSWKTFLPLSIASLMLITPLTQLLF